jgi:penicillin amidase
MILFGNASIIEFEILATIIRDYLPAVAATPVMTPLEAAFVMPPEERPAAGNQPLSYAEPFGSRPLPDDAAERLAEFVRRMAVVRPGGSNNWAIDGRNTASGRPIIAGDPHQQLESPSLMWVHHMNSADKGGSIDIAGFAFVGSPGVQLGHNRHVAWTATTNYPDTMDIWGVAVEGGVARLGGEDVPVEVRMEEIVVRGEGTRSIEVVEVPGRGVLLPEGLSPLPVVPSGQRLLLGWTGFRPTHDIEAFTGMGAAEDLDAMEAAVDKMETGNFNFVSASAGGISYRSSASVPDRGAPSEALAPFMILDGADPSTLWTGDLLPLDLMPHSRGGERGWIASANNDPFGFTSDGSFVGDPYYFGVFFDPGTRAARIESEIAQRLAAGPLTVEDAQAIQTDTYSRLADRLVPLLEQVYATVDADDALAAFRNRPELTQLVADLAAWDRRMQRSSPVALAYHAFMSFLTKRAVGDDFGITFDPIQNESPIYMFKFGVQAITGAYSGSEALLQEGGPLLVMQALDDTAAFLTERFGSTGGAAYTWADHHVTTFDGLSGDKLAGGSVPTDGADGTVNVSAAPFFAGSAPAEQHESHAGAIYRMVATFDEDGVPRATINYPRGNSGDPESPHWDDTLEDWALGRYATLLFRTSEVEAESTVELVLAP